MSCARGGEPCVRGSGQTQSVAVRLYRSMRVAEDGLPELGRSARTLGVRPRIDVLVDANGLVRGGIGGMSVAPDSPMRLPAHRRPHEFAGTGKDPIWELDTGSLGECLRYREDPLMPGEHGFLEPGSPMSLERYESALHSTRRAWRLSSS